MTFTITQDHC